MSVAGTSAVSSEGLQSCSKSLLEVHTAGAAGASPEGGKCVVTARAATTSQLRGSWQDFPLSLAE